jgi:hypothetical protein
VLTGFALCRASMSVVGITAPEQSVLTALAIMSNDDAQCWPAINGAAGLTGKTKLSERTVQRAVQALKDAGHINWVDKPGRGRVYIVHPRQSDTPSEATPVTVAPRQSDTRHSDTPVTQALTPVTVAPNQPVSTIVQKATPSSQRAKSSGFGPPDQVSHDAWEAFCKQRKKRMTQIAFDGIVERLAEHTNDLWPPDRLVRRAIECGHETIWPAPRDLQNARGTGISMGGNRGPSTSGHGSTVDAAQRVLARHGYAA